MAHPASLHPVIHTTGEALLANVPRDDPIFRFTVRDSGRVYLRARAGDAATIVCTANHPPSYSSFEAFTAALFQFYQRIGTNAINAFGSLVYSLMYHVTLDKHGTLVHTTFLIYPVFNGRIVTAADDDFSRQDKNIQLIDTQFHSFANKHGSGMALVSVQGLEVQFIKTRAPRGRGGTYFALHVNYDRFCVNVKNDDDERCFMYAILAGCYGDQVEDKTKPSSYERYIAAFNWDGITFPADYSVAPQQFESTNPDAPFALHVWKRQPGANKRVSDAVCVYISPKLTTAEKHVDLYFAVDEATGQSHYVYVHSITNFVKKAQRKGEQASLQRSHICRKCLRIFPHHDSLLNHYQLACYRLNTAPDIVMPTRAKKVKSNLIKYGRLKVTLFGVVYVDTVMVGNEKVIERIGYRLYCEGYTLPADISSLTVDSGHEAVDHFVRDMVKLEKYWSEWIKMMERNRDSDYGYHGAQLMVNDPILLHRLLASLHETAVNSVRSDSDQGLSQVEMGRMRLVDGGIFLKSNAKSVNEYCKDWQSFRQICNSAYGLDPAHFFAVGPFSWAVALKLSGGGGADIIQDEAIYQFLDAAKRGGINVIPNRYSDATEGYLAHFDIRSSYGFSFMQPLPFSDFKFVSTDPFTSDYIQTLADDGEKGYYLKVTLSAPADFDWHKRHADLPLAPYHKNLGAPRGKLLVCSHEPKHQYVLHYRLLKYYLERGMELDEVHEVLEFTQKAWLRQFAEKQQQMRTELKDNLLRDAIKLITNAAFGYSCLNKGSEPEQRLFVVREDEEGNPYSAEFEKNGITPKTLTVRQISPHLIQTTSRMSTFRPTSPIYVGITILELGKLWLYQSFYDKLRVHDGDTKLLYADTDSLIVSMKQDPLLMMQQQPQWFEDRFGCMKEEAGGSRGLLFVGTKPKHYCYITEDTKKVCIPGLNKEVSALLQPSTFIDVLEKGAEPTAQVTQMRIENHRVVKQELTKKYLGGKDYSRVEVDTYRSDPYGMLKVDDENFRLL